MWHSQPIKYIGLCWEFQFLLTSIKYMPSGHFGSKVWKTAQRTFLHLFEKHENSRIIIMMYVTNFVYQLRSLNEVWNKTKNTL